MTILVLGYELRDPLYGANADPVSRRNLPKSTSEWGAGRVSGEDTCSLSHSYAGIHA